MDMAVDEVNKSILVDELDEIIETVNPKFGDSLEAVKEFWSISERWYTGQGRGYTVHEALRNLRAIHSDGKYPSMLRRRAWDLSMDIVRNQDDSDPKVVQLEATI